MRGLNRGELIGAAFRLHRNNELLTVPVEANVHLINLNLPDIWNCRAKVTLKRIGGDPEEYVNEPVVSQLCEQCLLIT